MLLDRGQSKCPYTENKYGYYALWHPKTNQTKKKSAEKQAIATQM